MRHRNPFILGIARCSCDDLSLLFFGKGCRGPRTRCIGQHVRSFPAVPGLAQASPCVVGLQIFPFGLALLPTLTPSSNGLPSNGVFRCDLGRATQLGVVQKHTRPLHETLWAGTGTNALHSAFCLGCCTSQFFHRASQ